MMSSSQSNNKDNKNKDKDHTNNNSRDRKSKSLRLSQKLRGLRDLRSLRVSIDGGKPHLHSGQRRGSIQESPQEKEEEEYRIVHTPDRPTRFVSPVEAPTEDDCYDALRTWHYAAERERSGTYGTQYRSAGAGGEPTTRYHGGNDNNNDRSQQQSGGVVVPDPNDDELKTPKGERRWWELARRESIHRMGDDVRGMNPFRAHEWWEEGQQQQEKQKESDYMGQAIERGMDKEGSLRRGGVPPNINTDFTGLLPRTYNPNESVTKNDINTVIYPSQDEYTPSVYSSYSPSQSPKSPATPTPEMFPKAPTRNASESSVPIAKSTKETLPAIKTKPSQTLINDNESPTPQPGGRFFDVDEEYIPSGNNSRKGSVSDDTEPTAASVSDPHLRHQPPRPMDSTGRPLDFSVASQTQTLHNELLKLAHRQQLERKGSTQSAESGNSTFYSAFSSRPDTPDVRPPSRRGPGQQQQSSLSQGTPGKATGIATPETPRPKPPPKQTKPKGPQLLSTAPRFLKDRKPYISPSGRHPPPVPPKTAPEKKQKKEVVTMETLKLNGQAFIPHRPPPPIPNQAPMKTAGKLGGGNPGGSVGPVSISSLSSISPLFAVTGGNAHGSNPPRPTPSPTPMKAKSAGSKGMGEHLRGHIAGQVSISSLSSLAMSDSGGSVITPPRFSPTKPKPLSPAPPPSSRIETEELLTLPATVYISKPRTPVPVPVTPPVPVPSPLSKFNITHGSSSSGRNSPSLSNRPPRTQTPSQGKEDTHQNSPGYSDYLHPRISDPFIDSSPSSSIGDRFSIAMVNGVYNPNQAEAWKETMAMMVQAREQEKEAQMQKPKLIRVQSQKRVAQKGQGGQGKTGNQTKMQERQRMQGKAGSGAESVPRTPPPRVAQTQTPPRRTASPRYRVFPPQTQSQPKLQKQQSQHSLQPAPSPSLHPSPSLSLLRPIYPGVSRPQTPAHPPPPQTRNDTPPPPPSQSRNTSRTRNVTPPRQHQPHPSFRRPSQDTIDSKQGEQKQRERAISVSSDSSESSYESLKFWTNGPSTQTGVSRQSEENKAPEQLPKTKWENSGKKEQERKERFDFDSDDSGPEETGTGKRRGVGKGKGKGKGKGNANVDDYEELIDQYAGGWRETMFFGEPEE
ncbi:hypothetical protein B0T20DRAFT_28600 [Sordaria brevicollis]|uniref:Uncharacterized protein n=1 Tax=Sordaria brevicollis TaxID=83679 RepID=A0AAE0PPP0_SORBR|nr:hypothetical protein B0T20DRAFT_28600 [Sordaria brevicollis]